MNNLEAMKKHILLLETMLNNVGAFIYGKDIEGRYVYVNQAVLDLFEKSLDEVIGKDDSHFFDLPLSKQLKANDDKVMLEGVVIENEETNVVKASGAVHTYKVIKKPIFDEQGIVIGMSGISTDITEEKKLQKTVRQQKKLLDTVLNNIEAHVYMKNCEREFLYVNSKTAALFGRPVEDIVGRKETEILPPEIAEHFHQSDCKVFETNKKQVIDEVATDDDGNTLHYLSVKVPLLQEGELPALIGFSTDVTELYKLKEQFRKQANTDSLTKLFNRRYFVSQSEKEFHRAKRHNAPLSLVTLDIDYFKRINDQYGHPVGDAVLEQFAAALIPIIRSEDILARIGGEEFSILLPETAIDVATTVAERIREEQEGLCMTGDWEGGVTATVSIGVASLCSEDCNFEQLFKRADKALYQAKSLGRNRVISV